MLLLFTGILSSSAERIVGLGILLALSESLRLFFLVTVLAIVSPIIVVAYLHHLIQLILDRLDPDGVSADKHRGFLAFFPVAMSWWEGIYAWLVIILGTILTIGILGMMMPWADMNQVLKQLDKLYEMLLDVNKLKYLFNPATFIWIMIAAYLYQFEHVIMLRGRRA